MVSPSFALLCRLYCREHCGKIQETWKSRPTCFDNIAPGSIAESRLELILVNGFEYGDVSEFNLLLEEVSQQLEIYSRIILESDF